MLPRSSSSSSSSSKPRNSSSKLHRSSSSKGMRALELKGEPPPIVLVCRWLYSVAKTCIAAHEPLDHEPLYFIYLLPDHLQFGGGGRGGEEEFIQNPALTLRPYTASVTAAATASEQTTATSGMQAQNSALDDTAAFWTSHRRFSGTCTYSRPRASQATVQRRRHS